MISSSLIVSVKWQFTHFVAIDSMIRGYHEYQSIWDNPLTDGDLLCEQETGNSHNPQAMVIKMWSMVPQQHVVGHVLKKYLPIDIHMRLYACVKFGWQKFGKFWSVVNFAKFLAPKHHTIRCLNLYLYPFDILMTILIL